jgi:hypothetical protein
MTYKMSFEKSEGLNDHTITSNNVLCCADTGRVVAVFYNDYDLENLLEQLVEAGELVESKASEDWKNFSRNLENRASSV